MEKLCRIMDNKHNIRNISVIGHIHHGKSILADSLVVASDTGADEAERGMTIKSTAISLCYNMSDESLKGYKGERQGNEYLVNLIDSPGQVDFSYEVTAALRMTDGAIVVVDCIDGVRFQTESVIRQAMAEGVRPVLTLNKMDRCFLELDMDGEEAYENFKKIVEDTNDILCDFKVSPEKGTVAFSAGIDGWAFTLSTFATYYALKMSVDEETMIKRLWGDNFFDPQTKEWTESRTSSPTCTRGFVMFCYDPIKDIIGACMNEKKKDSLWGGLEELEVNLTLKEEEFLGSWWGSK